MSETGTTPFRLIYTDSYNKRARKFLKKHPEIRGQYTKSLQLLELNPYHSSLRLHGLQGRLAGLSSVSINRSYRIVLELIIQGNDILLVDIGSHDQVY
jgi:mRNA-degrading endonuclease YafQ of YafQ-DinJ toxin-antitoxin module